VRGMGKATGALGRGCASPDLLENCEASDANLENRTPKFSDVGGSVDEVFPSPSKSRSGLNARIRPPDALLSFSRHSEVLKRS